METMHAVQLTGHGGFDQLEYRNDIPVPTPAADEVLIEVGAAGVNNTDINTRIGWYSKHVTGATDVGGLGNGEHDGGWAGALDFPRIQGADAAGTIVAVGSAVDPGRVGQRVLVRTMQDPRDADKAMSTVTFGSEMDGAFAQFALARSAEAFAIECNLTDVELASFPCAYSTAEGLLHRSEVGEEDRVLITGASGGVGSAAVQLARRRGAHVTAIASESKWNAVRELGADKLIDRDADLVAEIGKEQIDAVIDIVAGPAFPQLLEVLVSGGRYAVSGAIAGPLVELDVRTLYLKDLALLGCTRQPREVFENLIGYIERDEIRPVVAATFPLSAIVEAQEQFLEKAFTGKLVLIPPPVTGR
jgi:NADPH:quinone reductase-like Zn-dependent oxidoreductase